MGVTCKAQERQPDHCDELIVYDGGRYHNITNSPSQQPGFPIVQWLITCTISNMYISSLFGLFKDIRSYIGLHVCLSIPCRISLQVCILVPFRLVCLDTQKLKKNLTRLLCYVTLTRLSCGGKWNTIFLFLKVRRTSHLFGPVLGRTFGLAIV